MLHFNDDFLLDGSEKNLAVCKVVPGMDDGGRVWRDTLVEMKNAEGSRMRSNPAMGHGHMDMRDLREVVDYLTSWNQG